MFYDPMGNRICKIEKPRPTGVPGTQAGWIYTWYSLDAQGQAMATYRQTYTDEGSGSYSMNFDHQETYVYGSARVGVVNDEPGDIESTRRFTATIDGTTGRFINVVWDNVPAQTICTDYCVYAYTRTVGMRQYELSNHLGNIQTTISDRRIAVPYSSTLDHYIADVISSTDYYPFGSIMPGRNSNAEEYRYGFNGKENDNEVKGTGNQQDYGMRIYDPRLGRFLSVDPLTKDYPWYTPYQFAGNKPITAIDQDGEEELFKVFRETDNGKYTCILTDYSTAKSVFEANARNLNLGNTWKKNIPKSGGVCYLLMNNDGSKILKTALQSTPEVTGKAISRQSDSRSYSFEDIMNRFDRAIRGNNDWGNAQGGAHVGETTYDTKQDYAVAGGIITCMLSLGSSSFISGSISFLFGADDVASDENGDSFGERALPNNEFKSVYNFSKASQMIRTYI